MAYNLNKGGDGTEYRQANGAIIRSLRTEGLVTNERRLRRVSQQVIRRQDGSVKAVTRGSNVKA